VIAIQGIRKYKRNRPNAIAIGPLAVLDLLFFFEQVQGRFKYSATAFFD